MNGRTRSQALASARAELDRQAQLTARRHARTAHALGWCHDSSTCVLCANTRAEV